MPSVIKTFQESFASPVDQDCGITVVVMPLFDALVGELGMLPNFKA